MTELDKLKGLAADPVPHEDYEAIAKAVYHAVMGVLNESGMEKRLINLGDITAATSAGVYMVLRHLLTNQPRKQRESVVNGLCHRMNRVILALWREE